MAKGGGLRRTTPLSLTSGIPTRSVSEGPGTTLGTSRLRLAVLFSLLTSAFTGCRSQPQVNAHIESVNSEYRHLEDYVYALEEANARLQQEIDALQAVSAAGVVPGGAALPGRGGLLRR